jgi:alkylation response protein AidB-like acyl-CoA dehydrogenase
VTTDFGLAKAYANIRTLRLADGPDEVHLRAIARSELRKYRDNPDYPTHLRVEAG